MSVLDNAKSHFDTLETRAIEVEEWDCTIYCTPFTLTEKKKLLKSAKGDDMEFLVQTLMLKARDENGQRVFRDVDRFSLMNEVDPNIIARVVAEISIAPSVEDQLGN